MEKLKYRTLVIESLLLYEFCSCWPNQLIWCYFSFGGYSKNIIIMMIEWNYFISHVVHFLFTNFLTHFSSLSLSDVHSNSFFTLLSSLFLFLYFPPFSLSIYLSICLLFIILSYNKTLLKSFTPFLPIFCLLSQLLIFLISLSPHFFLIILFFYLYLSFFSLSLYIPLSF